MLEARVFHVVTKNVGININRMWQVVSHRALHQVLL